MTNATEQSASSSIPRGRRSTLLSLAGLLALVTLVYLTGLSGPFLFDDTQNIVGPLSAWLTSTTGWQDVVFGNRSGPFGRPLSMLSFLGNAASTGLAPWPFKATNLVIHLLCGVLIYALLTRLLTRDPLLRGNVRLAALAVSALWLLHPIQASTVLYVVQRMAQLSALFALAALFAYVRARLALIAGQQRSGMIWLFVALPVATVAAVLSKENGALVPLLCGVVELGYFRATAQEPRPRAVKWFFCLFLLVPTALIVFQYGLHPQRLVDSYQGRLFTLGERVLTQPRVLMDYMGALLLPRGPLLGVYTDDFVASRGLLTPLTTLASLLGLAVLMALAWWSRIRMPAFFTGVGLYLASHAMESTVFPLELYFEHRNYLPSVGFFLALVGLGAWLLKKLAHEPRARLMLAGGVMAVMGLLAVSTLFRAMTWRSMSDIAEQGTRQHPQSMRAHLDYAHELEKAGLDDEARAVFRQMTTMSNPAAQHVGIINGVALECVVDGATDAAAVDRMRGIAGAKLQLAELLAFENLGNVLHQRECRGLTKTGLADAIRTVVDAANQPAALTQLWRSRFVASRLYLAAGEPVLAQTQAALAWMTGAADPAVGIFLANLYYINGDRASAELILADARKRIPSWDLRNRNLANELERAIQAMPT